MAAWAVHAFTATGAVCGLLALRAVALGEARAALAWMFTAVVIDAVDGTFARWAGVRQATPEYDGALLDNLVDYLNYAVAPAFFLLQFELVAGSWRLPLAAAVLLASAYQFAHVEAKTPDHFFRGFPSYWNVAVFYLHYLGWGPAANVVVLVLCVAATFVPMRWAYPTRMRRLRGVTLALGSLWGLALLAVLAADAPGLWLTASLAFVAYYACVSVWLASRS